MSASYTSISPDKLSRLIGTAAAPALIDVRIDEDFSADPRLIPGAVRRSHLDVQNWASRLTGQPAVVVWRKGKKLSEGTQAKLRYGREKGRQMDRREGRLFLREADDGCFQVTLSGERIELTPMGLGGALDGILQPAYHGNGDK